MDMLSAFTVSIIGGAGTFFLLWSVKTYQENLKKQNRRRPSIKKQRRKTNDDRTNKKPSNRKNH